jgi:DNA-binding transcriptional MerR regulator
MNDVPDSLDSFALADRLGISVRTLRSWIKARVLPRPPRQGHGNRFDRAAIVRAHAVAALRRDGVPLPHIARFLAQKGDVELRELGGLSPAPPPRPPIAALPADASPAPERAARPSTPEPAVAPLPAAVPETAVDAPESSLPIRATAPRETTAKPALGTEWRRIELVPGLELHVRADAPAIVQNLAAAIAQGRLPR